MAGATVTVASTLQCPHGGTVSISPGDSRVQAGAAAATAADAATVAGCPFQIPAVVPIPSPCVQVLWLLPDLRVRAGGKPTLSEGSLGLCVSAAGIPQGLVAVQSTQSAVSTQ